MEPLDIFLDISDSYTQLNSLIKNLSENLD
jgi:hypothetical protein